MNKIFEENNSVIFGAVKIGDTIFPYTKANGIFMLEYPMFNPKLAPKITEEGRKRMKELEEFTKNIIKERNIKIVYGK